MSTFDVYDDLNLFGNEAAGGNQLTNARQHNITTAARTTLAGTLGSANKGLFVFDTDLNTPYVWNGSAFITYTPVIVGGMAYKGAYTSLTTTPTTPAIGDVYVFTGTPGTLIWSGQTFSPSNDVEVGDSIIYRGTNVWDLYQKNDLPASETVSGNIQIATQVQTNAGTDDTTAVTPMKLRDTNIGRTYFESGVTFVANTDLVITHALDLQNKDAFVISVKNSSGKEVNVTVTSTTVNTATLRANPGITGATVFIIGD
jgi:hypothetical protein